MIWEWVCPGSGGFTRPVVGILSSAPGKARALKASPSGCLLEHVLCKKEDSSVSERLASRKEAQLKVKRALGVCVSLGRAGAAASFSPVTALCGF